MKTILTTVVLTFSLSFTLFSQLDNGSKFPANITGRDLMTNEDIDVEAWLNDDKTVIINFFTAWCSPCWDFKESNWLNDLNSAFGKNGSDQIRIISIEAEAMNTPNHIDGPIVGNGVNRSYGDWTDGITYPIIDDASFNQVFKVEIAPTIYIVRPDRSMIELNINDAIYNEEFQMRALFPEQKDINLNSDIFDATFCGEHEIPASNISVLNMGKDPIEQLTIGFFLGNVQVQSINYNQTILPFEEVLIPTEEQGLTINSEVNVFVSSINGESYPIDNNNLSTAEILEPKLNTEKLKMRITFDEFPEETLWTLFTDSGQEIAKKGYGSGEVEPWSTEEYEFTIPQSASCLRLNIQDSYGDGWSRWGENTNGAIPGIELFNEWGVQIKEKQNLENSTNFHVDLESIDVFISLDELSNTELLSHSDINVFPNPVVNFLQIQGMPENVNSFTISNLSGQLTMGGKFISTGGINVQELSSGTYFLKLNTDEGTIVKRFTKQ